MRTPFCAACISNEPSVVMSRLPVLKCRPCDTVRDRETRKHLAQFLNAVIQLRQSRTRQSSEFSPRPEFPVRAGDDNPASLKRALKITVASRIMDATIAETARRLAAFRGW
jgi:hypothetical protein